MRPGMTRLERFVATAREQAHEETFRQLTPLLSADRKTLLDGLLKPDATTGRTLLSWLRQEAVSHAASHIIATLTKIVFLHDAGVDQWNLSSLNPNRAKWLAQIGWKSTNQSLQRMAPERRYPVLVAFLQQALRHHTDIAVELFDQCVWGCHREAEQELEEFRKAMARSTNDKLKLFRELGQVLLDDAIEDLDVRSVSFERVPKTIWQEAIEETQAHWPFHVVAIVLLPDHLHMVWELPRGDANYSLRLQRLKSAFTRKYLAAGGSEGSRSPSRMRKAERAVWQLQILQELEQGAPGKQAHQVAQRTQAARQTAAQRTLQHPAGQAALDYPQIVALLGTARFFR